MDFKLTVFFVLPSQMFSFRNLFGGNGALVELIPNNSLDDSAIQGLRSVLAQNRRIA